VSGGSMGRAKRCPAPYSPKRSAPCAGPPPVISSSMGGGSASQRSPWSASASGIHQPRRAARPDRRPLRISISVGPTHSARSVLEGTASLFGWLWAAPSTVRPWLRHQRWASSCSRGSRLKRCGRSSAGSHTLRQGQIHRTRRVAPLCSPRSKAQPSSGSAASSVRSRTIRQCPSNCSRSGVGARTQIPYGGVIIHNLADERRDPRPPGSGQPCC